jgi:hypothetical protein
MRDKIHEYLVSLYAIVVAISVVAGALVAVLFVIGFIADGGIAVKISEFNLSLMNQAKKWACYAVGIGLIDFYLIRQHALTIDDKGEEEDVPSQASA